jgi:hypothetical protein
VSSVTYSRLGVYPCDLSSLRRDNGDCEDRFVNAAQDAILECDRSKCSSFDQDYNVKCSESCFKASCDWSKAMCAKERSNISKCPLFDSTVLSSIRSYLNNSLKFVRGGTSRYGTSSHAISEEILTAFLPCSQKNYAVGMAGVKVWEIMWMFASLQKFLEICLRR